MVPVYHVFSIELVVEACLNKKRIYILLKRGGRMYRMQSDRLFALVAWIFDVTWPTSESLHELLESSLLVRPAVALP